MVLGLTRSRPASGTVRSRVLEVSLADQFALVGTAWPYVYAAAGLLVLGAAVVMALTAARWPSRAARYERPGTTVPGAPASAGAAAEAAGPPGTDDPAALWRLLDAGVDPTAEATASSARAVVREQPPGVTMKPRVASRTDEPT